MKTNQKQQHTQACRGGGGVVITGDALANVAFSSSVRLTRLAVCGTIWKKTIDIYNTTTKRKPLGQLRMFQVTTKGALNQSA